MFDSLNFNIPFGNTFSMATPNFMGQDTSSFGFNSGFNSAFTTPWQKGSSQSLGAFGNFSMPWQNSFNPMMNSDFMSLFMQNPFTNMQSGCGAYVIDPKRAESKYSPMIERIAKECGIRADVAKALIKQESSFNPNAISKKGAMGLAQLMPATARELGVTNPYDPEQNLRGGMKYLAKLLKRYNGDYRKAVAAYNGGMGNIDKHGINFCAETSKYHRAILG